MFNNLLENERIIKKSKNNFRLITYNVHSFLNSIKTLKINHKFNNVNILTINSVADYFKSNNASNVRYGAPTYNNNNIKIIDEDHTISDQQGFVNLELRN